MRARIEKGGYVDPGPINRDGGSEEILYSQLFEIYLENDDHI